MAAVLARYEGGPVHAHLDNVAFELMECTSGHVALVLTPLQNRTIALALEGFAQGLESAADQFHKAPAIARTAHYSAGYLRSLLDRLVKGGAADATEGLERVVQLLALDAPASPRPGTLVLRALERLKPLEAVEVFASVLPRYAEEAARRCCEAGPSAASEADDFDFEIVDESAARSQLARKVFAAALGGLRESGSQWLSFLAALREGKIEGCEEAPEYPEVARAATQIAHTIAKAIRAHLAELAGLPWDAVSPGLKAILDRYPALKREPCLREFVTAEVRRTAPKRAPPAR